MPRNPLLPSMAQFRSAMIKAGVIPADVHETTLSPNEDVEGRPIPDAIPPQTEGRPAFIPYRGTNFHGVDPQNPMVETPEGFGDGTVEVHESDASEHVLPVYVVPNPHAEDLETITAWRATQMVAPVFGNGAPVQIAPRHRSRTKLKIENIAAADGCWIGPQPSVNTTNGYYLAPGANVDISSTEEVYAVSNTANPVPLSLLVEFTQTL